MLPGNELMSVCNDEASVVMLRVLLVFIHNRWSSRLEYTLVTSVEELTTDGPDVFDKRILAH